LGNYRQTHANFYNTKINKFKENRGIFLYRKIYVQNWADSLISTEKCVAGELFFDSG